MSTRCLRRFCAGTPLLRSACTLGLHAPVRNATERDCTGLSHRVTKSDTYEGYYIPAGSILIPNVWYDPLPPHVHHIYRSSSTRRCQPDVSVFSGECYTIQTSSPSPTGLTQNVGSLRQCLPTQSRHSDSERGCVPVVSSPAGACGRPSLVYWLRSRLCLRRKVLQRRNISLG